MFCNGNLIERVDSFKYLGIFFDSTLNFQSHFEHICSRVSSAVGCLLFIKRFLNVHTFKTLLNVFVLSIIDYGLIIWGKIPETKIKILQSKINNILGSYFYPQICNRFQKINRIAHSCSHLNFTIPPINYFDLYEQCNILTVEERISYFYAIFSFKCIRYNHIPELHESFSQSARNQNIILPQHKSDFFEKSPTYQSSLIRNWLPNEAKELDVSLSGFKKTINKWLLNRRLDVSDS